MNYCNQYPGLTGRQLVISCIIFFALLISPLPLLADELNNAIQNQQVSEITRTVANYRVPNVEAVRQDGKKLAFIKELDDGRPVVMNFIFASCSAICPMLSHVFSKVQDKLSKDKQHAHLVSISIDPENDTPTKLSEYAKKFGAASGWDFYTGPMETSIAIQKAFDSYRGDKMNHTSVVLMRAAPGKPWLRLEGFMDPNTVLREYRDLNHQ
jgi:protein SCO1